MNSIVSDAWRTIVPETQDRHGPLAPLLLGLTVVTGLVDAFSYLSLGHVFVANMTGNVVFLAFALAGAPGFSIVGSLVAVGAFSAGALAGGRASTIVNHHRGHLLAVVGTVEAVLVAGAAVIVGVVHDPGTGAARLVLIVVLSFSMGAQNAMARTLAVPDLTTTVLTLTITGISADSLIAGGSGSRAGRRLISVLSMFLGAVAGAFLVLKVSRVAAMVTAVAILVVVVVATVVLSRSEGAWTHEASAR